MTPANTNRLATPKASLIYCSWPSLCFSPRRNQKTSKRTGVESAQRKEQVWQLDYEVPDTWPTHFISPDKRALEA